jgi:hypothetical protein
MQYLATFQDDDGSVFQQYVGMHGDDVSAMGEARYLARQMGVKALRVVEA